MYPSKGLKVSHNYHEMLMQLGQFHGSVHYGGIPYAMVTNHLRAPYGVYFNKKRTILRRPYGARPAAGRIVRFSSIL